MTDRRSRATEGRLRVAVVVVLALAVIVVALGFGAIADGPAETITGVLAGGRAREVVLGWRAPRLAGALLAGAALGMSGATLQRLTRNPLAAPDILGIGQGAATGAVVSLVVLGVDGAALTAGSVVGGFVAALAVFGLAAAAGLSGRTMLVMGIAVSSMLSAASLWLLVHVKPAVSQVVSAWTLGSLTGLRWDDLPWPACVIVVATVALRTLRRGLDQLDLGTEVAASTGARPTRTLLVAGLAAVGLASAAVAICGPVAFVALLAPHLAAVVSRRPAPGLARSAVAGALGLAGADLIGQHLLSPAQLPAGVVSGAVGAVALFAMLAVRDGRRRANGTVGQRIRNPMPRRADTTRMRSIP